LDPPGQRRAGYKVHLTVDHGSGLLRRLALTAASTSESHLFEAMVIGTLKRHYKMERCRYLGRVCNRCHIWLKGICYSLKKMLVLPGAT
jgi:hypothetical protein